jgi:hypothetical protein
MNPLFEQYDQNLNLLRELEEDDLPRSLRLFNIRMRLAVDIHVDFKGTISLTKSKDVKDTYVLIIQLMELWNAYEALSHYVDETTNYVAKNKVKSKIYSQKFLKEVDSLSCIEATAGAILSTYKSSQTFKIDFDNYISRIINDEKLSKSIKLDASNVSAYVKDEKTISGVELLSLIYAERNMYYHNGETAKMGMSYSNRKQIIAWYKELLLDNILRVANAVVLERIASNR